MAETKTKPTGASVDAYLASRASPEQLADCKAIMAMCKRVTKQQPKMWGPSIVGLWLVHLQVREWPLRRRMSRGLRSPRQGTGRLHHRGEPRASRPLGQARETQDG